LAKHLDNLSSASEYATNAEEKKFATNKDRFSKYIMSLKINGSK
jgi:hypothetical protein